MKKYLSILCALALLFHFTACGKNTDKDYTEKSFYSMDTTMDLRIYSDTDNQATEACIALINSMHHQLSPISATSEVGTLNNKGVVNFSTETMELLQTALAICQQTNGAMDPTAFSISYVWGFATNDPAVPSNREIEQALLSVGADLITIDGQTVSTSNGAMLDFGAIAKGYAGAKCAEILQEYEIPAAILSLGGNIQTYGTKPDGSAWEIGIKDPEDTAETFGTLFIEGTMSIATSGNYERHFEENGKIYGHIMDPETGYPADSGLLSVTVVSEDGTWADGLSTALFVMGLEDATAYYQTHDNFEAVFMDKARNIYVTEGLTSSFEGEVTSVITK